MIASADDRTSEASSAVARSASFSAVTSSHTPTIRSGLPSLVRDHLALGPHQEDGAVGSRCSA